MHGDIVTRLRTYDFMRDGDTPETTMNEAADEIERLRKQLRQLEAERDGWISLAVRHG